MSYFVYKTKKYEKSIKKFVNSGQVTLKEVEFVVNKLSAEEKLEKRHRDHKLIGSMEHFRECHVQNDMLLVYKKEKKNLILILLDIGSHSDLFK